MGGIYSIVHLDSGKRYIGSAVQFKRRFDRHKVELKQGTHHNQPLQRAWNKYGGRGFAFRIVQYVRRVEDLISREQYWIDHYSEIGRGLYNTNPTAGSCLGRVHKPEARAKIAEANRRRVYSDETRAKMSKAARNSSPETRERMAEAQRGKRLSDEHRAKLREAALNRDPEMMAPIIAAHSERCRNRIVSQETRQKISKIHKGKVCSAETKAKIGQATRNRTAESRAKSRESALKQHARAKLLREIESQGSQRH